MREVTQADADDVVDAARREADVYRGDNPRPLGGIWRFWVSTALWWPSRRSHGAHRAQLAHAVTCARPDHGDAGHP
jgi:hypothetical protein